MKKSRPSASRVSGWLRLLLVLTPLSLAVALSAAAPATWIKRDSPTTSPLWDAVHHAESIPGATAITGLIVAVGEQGVILTSSDEGLTWSRRESGTNAWLTSVAYVQGANRFFAVGEGGLILSSADGIMWIRELSPTTQRLNRVAEGAVVGTVSAVGEAGANLLTRGFDGVWTQADVGFGARWLRDLAGGFAVGEGGTIFVRAEGSGSPGSLVPWMQLPSPNTADLEAIIRGPGTDRFIPITTFVGANGTILQRSPSGSIDVRDSGTTQRLRDVCYKAGGGLVVVTLTVRVSLGEYFAVGTGGTILRSADGISWKQEEPPMPVNLNAVLATPRSVIAFGDGGTILQCDGSEAAPVITAQPRLGYDEAGQAFAEAAASGQGALTYLWLQIGAGAPYLVGWQGPRQLLPEPLFPINGPPVYQLVVGNAFGLARSVVVATRRFLNLSSRAAVGEGEAILIGGFTVASTEPTRPRTILVRAVGPTLAAFGVDNALSAPRLTVFAGATAIGTNSGWSSNPDVPAILEATQASGAFPLVNGSADSVLLLSLTAGNYTAQVEGADRTTGIALVEVYDVGAPDTPSPALPHLANLSTRLANLSTRARVQPGEGILISGFVVSPGLRKKVLLRAAGPALTAFGLTNVVAHPQFALYRGNTRIATASAWSAAPNAAELSTAASTVGAFPFAAGSSDAALLIELEPGAYTLQVSAGDAGTDGIALTEVYELR